MDMIECESTIDICTNYNCKFHCPAQGCLLPVGCVFWSDTDNEEANHDYWEYEILEDIA